jgi:hypothetical protein
MTSEAEERKVSIETLYPKVTEAIMDAQELRAHGDPAASGAYLEVSRLEEQIAAILPASDMEGAVARRGAVRAASTAGDHERAIMLATRYAGEGDTPAILREELREIMERAGIDRSRIENALAQPAPTLAESLFPIRVGEDDRLHLAPPPIAPESESDPGAFYGAIRETLTRFAALLAPRSDGASMKLARLAQRALDAAPEQIEECHTLRLNRALQQMLFGVDSRELALGPQEISTLADIDRHFELLPMIFPALADFRKATSYDRFVSPPPQVKQIIVGLLDGGAAEDAVVHHELAASLRMAASSVAHAPDVTALAPEREKVWAAADAYLGADIQIEALETVSDREKRRGGKWRAFHKKIARPPELEEWRSRNVAA